MKDDGLRPTPPPSGPGTGGSGATSDPDAARSPGAASTLSPAGPGSACATCPAAHHAGNLQRLGVDLAGAEFVVGLAGNPNTGKSTVFNRLTGLRQHTGNWPGKTVSRAEGAFSWDGRRYKLVDLPGTYSLLSTSTDEEIARDFILFGRPDVTVVVVDATQLERNLNLVAQILEITDRAVLCLNLIDEAERRGITVNERALSRELGIPVVPTAARTGRGIERLLEVVDQVATGVWGGRPRRVASESPAVRKAVDRVAETLASVWPGLTNGHWVALRLLLGDDRLMRAVRDREFDGLVPDRAVLPRGPEAPAPSDVLERVASERWGLGDVSRDRLVEDVYAWTARVARKVVSRPGAPAHLDLGARVDRVLTSRILGFPTMIAMLAVVFWLTIAGANVPSRLLAQLLLETVHPALKSASASLGVPWWIDGFILDGMYLASAWVVSVMLPPMAIFFPIFTLLEDLGYLPRVAFNLDRLFKAAGAHGKQSLSMAMGFGCNAAGVVAARVIDSPRERMIAIVTNNFALCNGRWPTQILMATIFIGALAPAYLASAVSAGAVVAVALLGVFLTLAVSWFLSRTWLKGQASTFSLELPPYRPPRILQTIYTSIIDRTLIVLWRAVVFAVPAGAVIWLIANVSIGGDSLAEHLISGLDPLGVIIGLNGVILLAYVVAIPANEIVIPTILMLTVMHAGIHGVGEGSGVMFELDAAGDVRDLLAGQGGWTLLTGINLMLFSLVHNPCSTTIFTIWKETRSVRWTLVASLLPLALGIALCAAVAAIARSLGFAG